MKGRFTNDPNRWPQNQLADRTPLAGAMFQPVDSNKWRKPIMVILEPCPGCGNPASTVGEGTGYLCETCQKRLSDKIGHAEFVLEQFGPTCRFCGAVACKLENGNVQCHACGKLDDEPGYHDDSGEFPEPDECCQTPVVENPLAEWVAAIITSRAAAARQCANCETCEPGKYLSLIHI